PMSGSRPPPGRRFGHSAGCALLHPPYDPYSRSRVHGCRAQACGLSRNDMMALGGAVAEATLVYFTGFEPGSSGSTVGRKSGAHSATDPAGRQTAEYASLFRPTGLICGAVAI